MATTLTIKSSVNGLEQKVSPEQFETLKANGYKGRVIHEEGAAKTAKTPEEVKDASKK